MGRREQRAEMQSTWSILEPRVRGVPMRKKDLEDASTLDEMRAAMDGDGAAPSTGPVHLSAMIPRALIGRFSR